MAQCSKMAMGEIIRQSAVRLIRPFGNGHDRWPPWFRMHNAHIYRACFSTRGMSFEGLFREKIALKTDIGIAPLKDERIDQRIDDEAFFAIMRS